MNYATIKNCDIANGPGVRISLFVSGCTHHCKGCFNEVAWDFDYGEPFTQQTIRTILDMMKPGYIKGLTLAGRRTLRAGESGTDCGAAAAGEKGLSPEEHLGLFRISV